VKPSDVVGLNLADATAKLRQSGKTVTVKEVIDTTKPDGTVINATPSATPNDVTVTVARGPVVRFLDTIAAISGGVSWGTVDVSGTPHPHSTSASMGSSSGCQADIIDYDLGRDYRRLQVLTGLTDTSPTDLRVRFDLFVDGSPVGTVDSGFGEDHPLDVDVTGALRLRLSMSYLSGSTSCGGAGVWADAKLLGVPSEVPPETGTNSAN
jgi:hypothetical protein